MNAENFAITLTDAEAIALHKVISTSKVDADFIMHLDAKIANWADIIDIDPDMASLYEKVHYASAAQRAALVKSMIEKPKQA